MRKTKLLGLLLCFPVLFLAQNKEVTGKVIDATEKSGIAGVEVQVNKSVQETLTDMQGIFSIPATIGDTLIFTLVDYKTKKYPVKNYEPIEVELEFAFEEEINEVDEVVVIGYGTASKKNLTTAVSSIGGEAFEERPITNVAQAMQGNAAGVNVVQPSGKPGQSLEVQIRGSNSVFSGSSPLYVVDGVQTMDISGLNVSDIEDMQILKDASAAAIYGVKASSGVVLITTKKGLANKNEFSVNTYVGSSKVDKSFDVLNTEQFLELLSDRGEDITPYENMRDINTDWHDEVFKRGLDHNFDFSYRGGVKMAKVYASLGYLANEGVVIGSSYDRLSLKLGLTGELKPWVLYRMNYNFINSTLNNVSDNNNGARGGVILGTLTTPPFMKIWSEEPGREGQYSINPFNGTWDHPVAYLSNFDERKENRNLINFGLDFKLTPSLKYQPSISADILSGERVTFINAWQTAAGRSNQGTGSIADYKDKNWIFDHVLTYSKNIGEHKVEAMLGNSWEKHRWENDPRYYSQFPEELRYFDASQASRMDTVNSIPLITENTGISFFGRATYNYAGKYILMGTLRRDGISKLAQEHQWGWFPSVSGAWIISEEEVLKSSETVHLLKLRAGWGIIGNANGIDNYSAYSLADNSGNQATNASDDLGWETTQELNVGIDLGLFHNRLAFTVDYYNRKTTDMLMRIDLPNTNIPIYRNEGSLKNNGLEFTVSGKIIDGQDLKWTSNFNIAFNENKIESLDLQKIYYFGGIENIGNVVKLEEGGSLGQFYGYKVDKVDPTTGKLLFQDLNGDGNITPADDMTYIGSALPDYVLGFSNTFSYKNFNLDFLITGSIGNDIYNASRVESESMYRSQNQTTAVLGRYRDTNGDGLNDNPYYDGKTPIASDTEAYVNSDRWVEDGSYIRLKYITLSYDFDPEKVLGKAFKSLSIYGTLQNIFTWTEYSGFDPEVSKVTGAQAGLSPGIDYGTYPQVKSYVLGIKAVF